MRHRSNPAPTKAGRTNFVVLIMALGVVLAMVPATVAAQSFQRVVLVSPLGRALHTVGDRTDDPCHTPSEAGNLVSGSMVAGE